MAKNKKQPEKWVINFCENRTGGLGIDICEGSQIATVDFIVSMAFSMRDKRTLHLCDECAQRLKEHAENMGYDVEIE